MGTSTMVKLLQPKVRLDLDEEELQNIEVSAGNLPRARAKDALGRPLNRHGPSDYTPSQQVKDITNKIFELCSTLLVIYLMLVRTALPDRLLRPLLLDFAHRLSARLPPFLVAACSRSSTRSPTRATTKIASKDTSSGEAGARPTTGACARHLLTSRRLTDTVIVSPRRQRRGGRTRLFRSTLLHDTRVMQLC